MGLKSTSDVIAVSFDIEEDVLNTFKQEQINLTLDPLNNEVFVVLAVDLDVGAPSGLAGTNTQSSMSLTATSKTGIATLADSQCIARSQIKFQGAGYADYGAVVISKTPETPTGSLDYIAIVATNNVFVQVKGAGNVGTIGGTGRMWGYRARADTGTYAALIQSEVLSA
tara:strand:- start:402 stop:908 length:507 start_codon:yes stop_codon:yes gene_type:complete